MEDFNNKKYHKKITPKTIKHTNGVQLITDPDLKKKIQQYPGNNEKTITAIFFFKHV